MYKHSIYIHIPFCKARCGYCAFSSCTDYTLVERYFRKLFDEIDRYADKSVPIYTLYLGGGTPSSVDSKYLDALFDRLRTKFDMSQAVEVSVECNPESATEQLLRCLKNNGVNRLSFGLQSVNDQTLNRIGRLHDYAGFTRALHLAVKLGFDNINADLIVGLPESQQDFYRSVDTAVELPLQHVSVYALELHKGTALYNLCQAQYPFSDDELADMYDYACDKLTAHGYERYEISNFARVGRQCLHNLNYWQMGRCFAFGVSASGFVENTRYTNPMSVRFYLDSPVKLLHDDCQQLTVSDQANECAMLGLRLSSGVALDEFRKRYGVDFFDNFANAEKLVRQGFLTVNNGTVTVPSDKLYVVNSILCELLNFDEN